jgi:[glutamine synthetase] adenylyltransferase / [glutamine synthetase]-adenylyl-L-tyrosine phosphorylase
VSLSALARLGFEEPEAAAADLERLGAWPPAAAPGGNRLLSDIAASAAPQLAVMSLAAVAAAHPDPAGFAARLRGRLGFRRRLVPVVAASRSLGAFMATHPEEADRLADGRRFAAPRPRADLVAEATALVAGAPPSGSPGPVGRRSTDPLPAGPSWDALRRFKRRELLRVAVRDLAAQLPVELVAAELADLADACLYAALRVAAGESGYDPPPMRLAILGMGKLGGTELNYVSDIDVLFCHEPLAGAEAEAAARAAERVARGVIRGLSAVTAEGTCFEVDANLRPEGRNGPLSRTLGSYRAYWDRWAQPWELQALIKVRPVAGDQALARRFAEEAQARVYPERLDPETVSAVRRMKSRVETSAKARADGDRQVKLGPGGLRDIEFAVQLLQLVHGRHDPELRSGSTLVALDRLTAAGFVGRTDTAQLATAYRFLRLVEHRLQLASERRTHTIPAGEEPRRWLARTLGYRDSPEASALERFEVDRRRHLVAVRGLHEKLFYRPLLEAFGAVPAGLDPEGAAERLAALGFANPERAMASLRALTAGLSRRATLMRAMLPVMLPWLAEAPDPDGGLAALRVLAEALGDRAAFYGMVRDNPAGAELLCTVLGSSRLLGDLLARHPELLTAMADPHRLAAAREPAELVASASAIVARHTDAAAAWDGLRRFKRRELVRVAVRDLTGQVPVEQAGAELSALAQACLAAGLLIAMREAGEGSRSPGELGLGPPGPPPVRLAVLAMGKLGGAELSYTSDLDVVFCHEPVPGADPEVAGRAADRVLKELLRGLSAVTPEGTAFEVDPNLRPEGRNGPLSRTLGSYRAYWDRWAEPWERQALIKVRPVAGDHELAERFCQEAAARVYVDPIDPATVIEVRRMKARVESERLPAGADPKLHLKLGPGGLADVEWTAQLLQLRFGATRPEVRAQPTLAALDALATAGALDPGEAAWLADAYRLCLRIRNLAYLVAGRPVDSLPTDPVALERLARVMGEPGRQRLLEDYRRATRRARRVVDKRFWDDPR